MIKYELITDNKYDSIVEKVLQNRNIHNLEEIKYPNRKNVLDKYLLDNIELAVERVMEGISGGKVFGLIWDCDCDGYCSGAIIHNYLKTRFENIKIRNYFHTGKKHGITDDIKLDKDIDILLVVDGGSNNFKQHKELKERGIEVIVLDHHEAEKVSEDAIIVNNQLSNYPNKDLSGVGICYKFCKVIDDYVGETEEYTLADEFLDLVAVGNIGDMVNLRTLETRYYAYEGIHNIKNKLLKALVNKQSFSLGGKMNYEKIAFCIVPLINALIREGKQKDKELMAEAFMDVDRTVPYKKRGASEEIQVHIADECARLMVNAKGTQDRKVKKAYGLIGEKILEKNLHEDKVIMIDVTDILDSNFTGLVANKLLADFKKPILLMQRKKQEFKIVNKTKNTKSKTRKKVKQEFKLVGKIKPNTRKKIEKIKRIKQEFGGSARGCGIDDFKAVCTNSQLFKLVEGHANAFGIGFDINKEQKIRDYFNLIFKDAQFSTKHIIDLELDSNKLNPKDIITVGQLEDIWNRDLKEPLFLIKNIHIKDSDIKITDSKSKTIYFKLKNLSFKKKYANDIILDEMRCKDTSKPHFGSKNLDLSVVGKFKISKVGEKEYPVIEIVDYISEEYKELIF